MAGTGGKREGAGRPKGVGNKTTELAREAVARFVDDNAPKFQEWLDEIYAEHGAKEAFGCVKDLIEYHIPKLSRQDLDATLKGDKENPVVVVLPSKE